MKKAKFLMSHFDAGAEKFKAGEAYELTEETRLCIARGAAVEVDVPDQPAGETKAADTETKPADGETQAPSGETPATEAAAPAAAPAAAKSKK